MRGPAPDSTNPPNPPPTGDAFLYELTPAARDLLAEHERATGTRLHRPAVPSGEVAEAVEREEKRRRRGVLRRRARRRGRRFGTVSYRWRETEYVPALRVSGKWLRRAGFDVGQELEIVVGEGRLVIEAL